MNRTTSHLFRKAAARVLLVSVAAVLIPTFVLAQSFRGAIRGQITDPSGSVVAGAKVTAKNVDTGLTRETITTGEGTFVLAELPAGTYTVTVNAAGFAQVAQNVVVNVGLDTTADFGMLKVERQHQTITVNEEAPLVEATGDPSGVAGTEAGFGQFNINGNRDRSNNYTLDGTDNNDPFFNNSALNQVGITGAPATLLPLDAIQEFNLQSQFGAEYGRNSGSVVNIVTRSGTNEFHGSLYEFNRNSAFDARNYFNTKFQSDGTTPNPQSRFNNNNFGGSLGGPVVKDKLFFFFAYEGQRERVGSDFALTVPSQAQIAAAQNLAVTTTVPGAAVPSVNPALIKITNLFPTSDSNSLAYSVRDKNDGDNLIGKVDYRLNQNNSLSARYAFGQSNQVFPLGSLGGYGSGSRLSTF